MIARFKCQVSSIFSIPAAAYASLVPAKIQLNDMEVLLHPPRQAAEILPKSLGLEVKILPTHLSSYFNLKEEPTLSNSVKVDGEATIDANLIIIDFKKDNFRRLKNQSPDDIDPSLQTIEKVLEQYLVSVRTITQASEIKFNSLASFTWMIQYLNDDYSELLVEDELFRTKFKGRYELSWKTVNKTVWEQIKSHIETESKPHTWETLYLDARSIFPDGGAAVTLTYAALENLISYALEYFAKQKNISPEIWEWIKEPANDWKKGPSVGEEYSDILAMLTGNSLKNETKLWDIFCKIRNARRTFVHEGVLLDIKTKKQLANEEALNLVVEANGIIEWIENQLPEEKRRKKNNTEISVESSMMIGPLTEPPKNIPPN